jgi:hypothetical protein
MSRLAALRLVVAVAAITAVTACTSPTAPTAPRRAPNAHNSDGGLTPDSTCRGFTQSGSFTCLP